MSSNSEGGHHFGETLIDWSGISSRAANNQLYGPVSSYNNITQNIITHLRLFAVLQRCSPCRKRAQRNVDTLSTYAKLRAYQGGECITTWTPQPGSQWNIWQRCCRHSSIAGTQYPFKSKPPEPDVSHVPHASSTMHLKLWTAGVLP